MIDNRWIPAAQWLALGLMTFEHVARFVLPESWGLWLWAMLLGRAALPLFAGMVAWHLAFNTRDSVRYARRLLVIACIAQVPYMLAIGADHLNVVFTLAAGVLVASVRGRVVQVVAAILVLGVAAVFPSSFEYGLAGVLLVPAFVLAYRLPWLVPLLVCVVWQLNGAWLFSLVALLPTVGLLLVRYGLLRLPFNVPAMSRRVWLSWYPLHLALIFIASIGVGLSPG